MMKEYLSIYLSSYIYANLFLIPVFVFYLYIAYRKSYVSLSVKTHKIIVASLVILPLLIMAYSYKGVSLVSSGETIQPSKTNTIEKATFVQTSKATHNNFGSSQIVAHKTEYPEVKDILFYFIDLIALFSLFGVILFLLKLLIQKHNLNTIIKKSKLDKLENNVTIVTSNLVLSPFAVGIIKKMIFIPENLSDKKKQIVLEHEFNHFQCNHNLWALVEALIAHVFWFNPISYFIRNNGAILRELECDSKTIKSINKYDYSKELLNEAETLIMNNNIKLLAHSWVEKKALRKRIEYILGEQKSKRRTAFKILLFSSVAMTIMFFVFKGNINDSYLESLILNKVTNDYAVTAQSRTMVDIDKVPNHFLNTLLVHEDRSFLEHNGVSIVHVIRASLANLKSVLSGGPKYVSGGSTITQQLAKSFLKENKSLERKFKELKIARVIEKNFSKKKILEMYLNRVYFGNNAWGLDRAATTYYSKNYSQLSLQESAMLVPFLEAPAKYNMFHNLDIAKKRQQVLLANIEKVGNLVK